MTGGVGQYNASSCRRIAEIGKCSPSTIAAAPPSPPAAISNGQSFTRHILARSKSKLLKRKSLWQHRSNFRNSATAIFSQGNLPRCSAAISATIAVYEPLAESYRPQPRLSNTIFTQKFHLLWDFSGSGSNHEGSFLWQQSSNKGGQSA